MNQIKLSLAGAALFVCLGTAGASAMPMNNLSGLDAGAKPDQVRLVCDRFGRCWNRPSVYRYGPAYGYPAYGYRAYGFAGPRYYRRGGWRYRNW